MLLTASANTFYSPVYNNATTTLVAGIGTGTSTIIVTSTAKFPQQGVFSIGEEVVYYGDKTSSSFLLCQRGFDGTVANNYPVGTLIELRWVAAHHEAISNEIVHLEGVLGSSISGAFTTVASRLATLDDTSGAVPPSGSARLGAMYYLTGIDRWYIYNGSSWSIVSNYPCTISGDGYWELQATSDPTFVFMSSASMTAVNQGAMFSAGSLRDALNSISGQGIIGRDDALLSYRTGTGELVQLVDDDRLAAPRIASLGIDYPEVDKISAMAVMPSGIRNISNVYMVLNGVSCGCTIALCKLVPNANVSAYSTVTIIDGSISSVTEYASLSQQNLGTWNDSLYTVTAGDILFTRVTSISGTPGRVVLTVEAPYYPLGIVIGSEWQNTDNTGPAYDSNESGDPIEEIN